MKIHENQRKFMKIHENSRELELTATHSRGRSSTGEILELFASRRIARGLSHFGVFASRGEARVVSPVALLGIRVAW